MHSHCALFRPFIPGVLPVLIALALAGCGDDDDPTGPPASTGAYEATTWTVTEGGTTTDVLAAGGSFAITLTSQGTTTGRLFVPAAVTGEGDFDADLTGTWTQRGAIVEFSHAADTFVRDMPFTVQGATLVGDHTFGGARIRVTLTRAP
jgi:hypothetical protein